MTHKFYFISCLFSLMSLIVIGQDSSKEFGEIGNDEIELTEYALDKDAEAVVLFDMAKSYFGSSGNVIFERTTRIKILAESGIKWAEVEIPFYREGKIYEHVYDLEASAYNFENGKLIKSPLNPSNVFNKTENDYWTTRKFAIPNVKKGTVIEYQYKIESQYKFNFRDWEFQWKIPVMYSEYMIKMTPVYEYTYLLQGTNKFDIYEKYEDKGLPGHFGYTDPYRENAYHDMVYKFGMKNVPAFGDEEYISSIDDYIIKLDFQLSKIHNMNGSTTNIITTWKELTKTLLKDPDFGKYINKSKKSASKLLDVKKTSQKTELERFNMIMDFVKGNYNWNNQNHKFASKSPNNLLDDKFGNCADLNLFTVGLLRSVGIESYPVIMSTRDHGKIKIAYPFSHFFNYVIISAKVDGRLILTDATDNLNKNDRIPPRCINDRGLIIKKDKIEWIDLGCLLTSSSTTSMQLDINENDISVGLLKTGTEYDALFFRKRYTGKVETVKPLIDLQNYTIIDSTIVIQNQKDKTKPYKLRYSFTTVPERVNDKMYISPFLHETISDNPLKQKERKYPIDMIYPETKAFNSTLFMPKGYQVDFVPDELKINNELFELNFTIKTYTNKIHVFFEYSFKKPVYQSEDYAKIKYYFDEIVKKGNEKIVFSKMIVESAQN